MKRYRVTVDGRTYEVEIDDPRARPITARVLGEVFRVEVESVAVRGSVALPSITTIPAPSPTGQRQVPAPIPGTITALMASVGQAVQRGDGLVTIEAMKMFNVIRSPWTGTVSAVHVAVGEHVAQGELLVSIVPA